MHTFLQDARYSLRMLWHSPGFTLVAVLTLALGIGANVAIYSVIDAVLINPLPYQDTDRLVFVWGIEGGLKSGSNWNSYPDVVDFEQRNEVFDEMASVSSPRFTVTGADLEPLRVAGARISHDLPSVLGVTPEEGRVFRQEEDRSGGEPVLLIGHGLRNDLFGEDARVLGRTLTVDSVEHTIVGVMPPSFTFPNAARLWTPLEPAHAADHRGTHRLLTVARLKPGVSMEQAEANMVTIAAALEAEYPDTNHDRSARVEPLRETFFGSVRPPLIMLFGAVGLVLLIACANVANLLLARATVRHRELAVRSALGASPSRIVRQLLTESLMLALIGGTCGVLFAVWSLDLLVSSAPQTIPRIASVGLNLRVLGFALLVTLAAGVLFGLVPAIQGWGRDLQQGLKEGARGWFGSGQRQRVRQGLVVAEIALAFIVVAGAGLLANSFLRLVSVDPGFRGDSVLSARISLPEAAYPEWQDATRFFDRLLDRVEQLPGVESAAAGHQHPLAGGWETSFVLPGVFEAPEGQRPEARILPVTPGYFATVGMQMVRGRDFTDRDDGTAPGVVVINESFAQRFFPDGNPLGHTLQRGKWWPELPNTYEIVGVVADVKMDGLATGTPWAMYYPQKQVPFQDMYLFVRTATPPSGLAGVIRGAVWELDPNLPVEEFSTLGRLRRTSLGQERFQVTLLGLFAIVALVLAAIGIYGVLASGVAQRRGEIGVRMALGANPRDVLRDVVGQGIRLTAVGLVLGIAGTLFATRLLRGLLFEVSAMDPITLSAVGVFFTVVAVLACILPATRATRVDPMAVLRAE